MHFEPEPVGLVIAFSRGGGERHLPAAFVSAYGARLGRRAEMQAFANASDFEISAEIG